MEHPLDEVVEVMGSQAAIARELGVTRGAVGQWKLPGGRIPAEYCPRLEAATARLGRRVLCERMRPDIAWSVVRSAPMEQPGHPATLPPVTPAPAPSTSPSTAVTRDCRAGEATGHAPERTHPDKSQLKWPECGERREHPPEVPGSGAYTRRKNPDLRKQEPAL
jgi:DNA-binding transcriptional regulator YdaS (Cro superfamily)